MVLGEVLGLSRRADMSPAFFRQRRGTDACGRFFEELDLGIHHGMAGVVPIMVDAEVFGGVDGAAAGDGGPRITTLFRPAVDLLFIVVQGGVAAA